MNSLCPFRNIFGQPRQGSHSYRIFDFAIVDILGTFILVFLIWLLLGKKHFFVILLVIFIIAELLHYMFCVETKVMKLLGFTFNRN